MTESTTATVPGGTASSTDLWRAAMAGIAAGVVFGLMIQFVLERMTAIGALYTLGEPSLSVGWAAHFAHSAIFGTVFGLLTWWGFLSARVESPVGSILTGAGYGAVLWFVNIVFIWPLWLGSLPSEAVTGPPVPYLASVKPLMGHLVWGLLLGGLYRLLQRR